jgi:hypothetical protein
MFENRVLVLEVAVEVGRLPFDRPSIAWPHSKSIDVHAASVREAG